MSNWPFFLIEKGQHLSLKKETSQLSYFLHQNCVLMIQKKYSIWTIETTHTKTTHVTSIYVVDNLDVGCLQPTQRLHLQPIPRLRNLELGYHV